MKEMVVLLSARDNMNIRRHILYSHQLLIYVCEVA